MADIIIGSQIWSGKNHDVNYSGSKVYDNNEANRAIYGGLYTYNQAINTDFVPTGYRLPALSDWNKLINYAGGLSVAGGILKETGTTHWDSPNTDAVDTYGFAALGGGWFGSSVFASLKIRGYFLTASTAGGFPYVIQFDFDSGAITITQVTADASYVSVRFIKDVNLYVGYGALYNWYVIDTGLLAPAGWHVPTDDEWNTLVTSLGGDSVAGGKMKEVGTIHWTTPNTGADNSSGFTALPGGMRVITGVDPPAIYDNIMFTGYWMSSSIYVVEGHNENGFFGISYDGAEGGIWGTTLLNCGLSVRLIKDDSTDSGIMTDYDGNIYPTVKIGDQVWMASNLTVTHYNDGTLIPHILDNATWATLTTGAYSLYGELPPIPPVEVPVLKLIIGTDLVDFNEPFNVMYSIGDIRDISYGNNNKTYTLNLPLTKKNKKALAFINQADVKSEINARAWLYLREILIISGSVVITDYGDYFAKVLISSDDWIDNLSTKKLSSLDLSAFDHLLTNVNVAASWTASDPFYRYPMINFGALQSGETNTTANWWTTDFIPMFSIAQLLTKILEPFTISSSWLATVFVKNLFIIANEKIATDSFITNKDLLVAVEDILDNYATGTSSTVMMVTLDKILDFLTKTTDQADAWASSYYTIPETGTYRFKVSISLVNTADGNASLTITDEQVIIDIFQNAVSLKNFTSPAYSGTELINGVTYELDTGYCHCETGDIISIDFLARCYVTILSGTQTVTIYTNNSTNLINIWSNANKYSGLNKNISVEELLPDMTQLDFLSAIRDIFNLRFWMDKSRQIIYIEPWDQFLTAEVIDLSEFIDYESIETELISKNYNKNITLKWKDDDSDEAYKEYLKTNESPGKKDLVLNSIYTKAGIDVREYKFSSIIEGVNHTIWEYSVLMPRIWTEVIDTAPILFDRKTGFNTRIVEWKGLTAGFTWYFEGVAKITYPKIQGLDWTNIYADYWIKFMHYVDKGKLFTIRMKLKPGILTQFFTVINDSTKEGFRPTYCIEINSIKNYFAIQKITSDGELGEIEAFLKQ